MESNLLELMLKIFAKQYGINETAVAELLHPKSEEDGTKLDKTKLNPKAFEALLAKDVERVAKIKENVDTTKIFDKAHGEAKKTVLTKVEKALAKEHGIEYEEGKTKLSSLIQQIVDKSKPAGGDLTDDKIKKSNIYLALEKELATKVTELTLDKDNAVKDIEAKYAAKGTLGKAKERGGVFFDELNPVLSEDKTRATNQRNNFLNGLNGYGFQESGDDLILLDSDGKRLEDAHGHPITLKAKISELATATFDFQAQGEKGNAGNEGEKKGGGKGVKVPDSEEAYNEAIFNTDDIAERAKITAAYEKANPKN